MILIERERERERGCVIIFCFCFCVGICFSVPAHPQATCYVLGNVITFFNALLDVSP